MTDEYVTNQPLAEVVVVEDAGDDWPELFGSYDEMAEAQGG